MAAWRPRQHLVLFPTGIVEPPQYALPRESKSLGQARFVLGAALADIHVVDSVHFMSVGDDKSGDLHH